jgi:glycosyltransferase involved in cell wall biosynthesis
MDKVSVIIPARNERYLQATIDNLVATAAGAIEVIPVMDGTSSFGSPAPHPLVKPVFHAEPQGMRPSIDAGAVAASGEYLMKCDAHCIFAPGWDQALQEACGPLDLVVPTRHSIDPELWIPKWRHFNYHYLTFPYDQSMYGYGLHAKTYDWDVNKRINSERAHLEVDDLMTMQGSCWLMRRARYFEILHPLDHANFYFYQEAQEVGLKVWLAGGSNRIVKSTWYAHLHKGSSTGRGFFLSIHKKRRSEAFGADFFMEDRWTKATRPFAWLVDKFRGDLVGWPADWREPKYRAAFLARPEAELPAHI